MRYKTHGFLVLLALLAGMAGAAPRGSDKAATDAVGIPTSTPFDLPLSVNGQTVLGKALLQPNSADEKPLSVFYVQADGSVGVLYYGLIRHLAPLPPGPGPTPPGPTPLPPGPTPTPPVVGQGHVLILYDAKTLDSLSVWQATAVRRGDLVLNAYLDAHCSKTAAQADYRIFDASADVSQETADWQAVFNRPHAQLPWIVIRGAGETPTAETFFEGPLPQSQADTIALLGKYLGAATQTSLLHIDDSNYKRFIGDGNTITLADGTTRSLGRTSKPLYGGDQLKLRAAKDWLREAGISLIPRQKWASLIQAGQGTFLDTLARTVQPCKDQDGLGYCWVYGTCNAAEVSRIAAHLPYVALAPESLGGPLTGWRNQGGMGSDAVRQLTEVGACANVFLDQPNSLRPSNWKSGWEADRANFRAYLSLDVTSWDEVITFLLLRVPLTAGYDWWGHEVALYAPTVLPNGQVGLIFRNSWGDSWGDSGFSTLDENRGTPSDCQAILAMLPAEPHEMLLTVGAFKLKNEQRWKTELKQRYDALGVAP